MTILWRAVAQSGSAHAWGAWGRRFESCQPDHYLLSTSYDRNNPQL